MTADASEAVAIMPGPDGLLEYEALLDGLSLTHPLSGLCFYDRAEFSTLLSAVVGTHPGETMDRQVLATTQPGVVTVTGELDVSNVELLRGLLARAVPRGGVLTIDTTHALHVHRRGQHRRDRRTGPPTPAERHRARPQRPTSAAVDPGLSGLGGRRRRGRGVDSR